MTAMISASVKAGPLFHSTDGVTIMAGQLYIHGITPELAAQWCEVLSKIAEGSE